MNNVLLTLGSLAFVAIAIFLLPQTAPDERAMAYGTIAFFGACSIVGAMALIPRRRAVLDQDGGLTLLPNRAQMIGLALAAFGMAVGCFLIAPEAARAGRPIVVIAGYVGAVFFGGCGLIALWRIFTSKPLGRMDSTGARWFGVGGWELTWREVAGLSIIDIHGAKLLRFDTDAPPNLPLHIGERAFSVTGTEFALEDVAAIAEQLWTRHRVG